MAARPPGHGENAARSLSLKDFAGVNTQADRTAIKQSQFSWLENIIPIGPGNLACVPAPSGALASTVSTILSWEYVNLNGNDRLIIFLTDGSAYQFDLVSTLVQIAPTSTFTGTPRASQWKNERALIIATNGYWSWDGSSLVVLFNLVQGFTITAPGSGYTSVPSIGFSGGGGSGAAATAIIGLVAVSISAAGTGYAVGDVLNLTGGTSIVQSQVQVTTTGAGGSVTAVAIKTAGNYTVMPANPVATTGGFGTGCTLTAIWGLAGITLTNAGTGYTSTPTVSVTGGGGSGATVTAILTSAPSTGTAIATYAGHVWIASGRTITYSAPGSYADFSVADGGGSTIITDEAFHSNITGLCANNNYLYVTSVNGINLISNVNVPASGAAAGLTTFSNVNITNAVGTNFPASLVGYQRAVVFADSYGFHGIFGATVKKMSDDIDGTFPNIDTTKPISCGLALVLSNVVPCFLFQYFDPLNGGVSRPLLACNHNGKWWMASQGSTLTMVVGTYVGDKPTLFGTDGIRIYKLFSDTSASITSAAYTALMPMDAPWETKQALKIGMEVTSPNLVVGSVYCQSETGSSLPINAQNNTFIFTNSSGQTVTFYNNANQVVNFLNTGLNLFQGNVEVYGRYLGAYWTSTSPGYKINGFNLQFKGRAEWGSTPGNNI